MQRELGGQRRLLVAARQDGDDFAGVAEKRAGDLLLVRLQRLVDQPAEREDTVVSGFVPLTPYHRRSLSVRPVV